MYKRGNLESPLPLRSFNTTLTKKKTHVLCDRNCLILLSMSAEM